MKDYAEMLQALADKFGTTVEHLWGVMVYQAPLSSTTTLITFAGWVAFLMWGFKFIQSRTTKPEGDRYQCAAWEDETARFAWTIWGIMVFVTFFLAGGAIEEIATGYINPEYWALMKLKG